MGSHGKILIWQVAKRKETTWSCLGYMGGWLNSQPVSSEHREYKRLQKRPVRNVHSENRADMTCKFTFLSAKSLLEKSSIIF